MARFCIPLNNGKVTQGLPLSDHVVLNIGEPVYPRPFKASPGALGVIIRSNCLKTSSISLFKIERFFIATLYNLLVT